MFSGSERPNKWVDLVGNQLLGAFKSSGNQPQVSHEWFRAVDNNNKWVNLSDNPAFGCSHDNFVFIQEPNKWVNLSDNPAFGCSHDNFVFIQVQRLVGQKIR